jgi:molybdate transport system ATP-binding protein
MGLDLKITTELPGFTLDVSWSIQAELVVLFGHSGAGKSMTLQTIAGITRQGGGHIRLNGRTLFSSEQDINLPPQQRSVGYVFQDLALFPHMTVRQNILYGAHGIDKSMARQQCSEMMELFRLDGQEDKYPHEISGGQKQRVAFARALIRKPGLLLLDEPFSSLDNPLRLEMRKCLMGVLRDDFRVPTVLVTHDVLEAYTLADRVLIYSNGRVIQSGLPAEVFNNPVNDEVVSLTDLKNLYPGYLFA